MGTEQRSDNDFIKMFNQLICAYFSSVDLQVAKIISTSSGMIEILEIIVKDRIQNLNKLSSHCRPSSYHHRISIMELGHLLTHSDLTYPEVSSKVCHDSFCQLENSVSLPWVIYYEAFYLHVVSSFSCTLVICPKLVLFLIPL